MCLLTPSLYGCPKSSALRNALFWVIMQQAVVFSYPLICISPFKMGPIGCPKMLVRNYHYSLWNYPKGCSSHLLLGRSLKSCKLCLVYSRCPFLDCSLLFALITLPIALPDHSLHLPAISVRGYQCSFYPLSCLQRYSTKQIL